MALRKTITDTKGITTEYHMIDSVETMGSRIRVVVKSYTDVSYRDEEKVAETNAQLKGELELQLSEAQDEELVASLTAQINALTTILSDSSVGIKEYWLTFNKEDDMSYAILYEKLKLLDVFVGAEDC